MKTLALARCHHLFASGFLLASVLATAGCEDDEDDATPTAVTIPSGALPADWTAATLSPGKSEPAATGQAGHAAGRFGLRASGAGFDPSGSGDEHLFVYRKASGNVGITARVVSADTCGGQASFGVILRPSLEGDSAYVLSATVGPKGLQAQARVFQGMIAVPLRFDTDTPLPIYLRVERRGFSLLAGLSRDNVNWQVKTIASPFPPELYLGLVATSHDAKRSCAAVFDSVTIDAAKLPLPTFSPTVVPDAAAGPADAALASDGGGSDAGTDPDAIAVDTRPPQMMQPGMMAMACNMLPFEGPEVTQKTIADLSPFPAGGPLKEGVYFRMAIETYTGPDGETMIGGSPFGRGSRGMLAITKADEGVYTVESTNSFGAFGGQRQNARWTRRGSSISVLNTCPAMAMAAGMGIAMEESITPFAMSGDDLLTFTVSRLPSGAPAVNVTRYTHQPQITYAGVGKAPVLPDAGAADGP